MVKTFKIEKKRAGGGGSSNQQAESKDAGATGAARSARGGFGGFGSPSPTTTTTSDAFDAADDTADGFGRPIIWKLPFIDGTGVFDLLMACGINLTFLDLSIKIGPLPPHMFKLLPKLLSLTASDAIISPKVKNERSDIEGTVSMQVFVDSFKGIAMADLLQLMR